MSAQSPFSFETRIRFIDTDASGRIHYTCLFRYFEAAEIEFMRSLGVSYRSRDIALPRVHAECDYLLAILYDDVLQIEVRVSKVGRASISLEFKAFKEAALAARGLIVIACMDPVSQRSVPIPEPLREKLILLL